MFAAYEKKKKDVVVVPIEDSQLSFFDLAYVDEVDQQQQEDSEPHDQLMAVNDNNAPKGTRQPSKQTKIVNLLAERTRDLKAIELLSTTTGLTPDEAEEVLLKAGGFYSLARLPVYALKTLPHITDKRARQIRAMGEWAVLLSRPDKDRYQVRSAADVANMLMLEMSMLEREELRIVGLDTKRNVVFEETIYKGSLDSAVVRVGEIFRRPIAMNTSAIVVVHNHPSGDPTPSPEDVQISSLIRETGQALDIDVLDSIVIGRNRFVSLKERGLGFL